MALPASIETLHEVLTHSSISHVMQRIGDRWTLSILLRAFLGMRRFDDFQEQLGIPRQTLSLRLKALVELGVLHSVPQAQQPQRMEYRLSDKGKALYGNVLICWLWEKRWGAPSLALPEQLFHLPCGHEVTPQMVCTACGEEVRVEDVDPYVDLSAEGDANTEEATPVPGRSRRWSAQHLSEAEGTGGAQQENIIELLNDRWAVMLLASVMVGCHSYDEMLAALGISTKALASRLKLLCNIGLLSREAATHDARRFIYRLTPPGRDLFAYIATLGSWGGRHLPGCPNNLQMKHRACGARFVPKVVCNGCHQVLLPRDMTPVNPH